MNIITGLRYKPCVHPVKWTSLGLYRMTGDLDVAALMLLAPGFAFICPGFLFVPKLAFLALIFLLFFQDHFRTITISLIKYFSAALPIRRLIPYLTLPPISARNLDFVMRLQCCFTQNLSAFQTFSGSFVPMTIPIFQSSPCIVDNFNDVLLHHLSIFLAYFREKLR